MGSLERLISRDIGKFDTTVGADDYVPETREHYWHERFGKKPPSMKRAARNGHISKTPARVK